MKFSEKTISRFLNVFLFLISVFSFLVFVKQSEFIVLIFCGLLIVYIIVFPLLVIFSKKR